MSIVLCVTVNAQGVWNEDVLLLEEMEHELVDVSALDVLEDGVMARSTKSISGTVAAYSHSISTEKVFLAERGDSHYKLFPYAGSGKCRFWRYGIILQILYVLLDL